MSQFVNIDIDVADSSVRLSSRPGWLEHLHELAQSVVDNRAAQAGHDDASTNNVSQGASMQASRPYSSFHDDIKSCFPHHRYHLTSMWDEESQSTVYDSKSIGEIIRKAGIARSGDERGDPQAGDHFLSQWHADFSSCRSTPELHEVVKIILDGKRNKRPGSTGVPAIAYKKNALLVAPIFVEAVGQLQDDDFDAAAIPEHLHTGLWLPAAKREGASTIDAVRDLEAPNEDCKVIERILFQLLDDQVGAQILPLNQAFVKGGDIMFNIAGLHEEYQAGKHSRLLRLLLLLDCMKGFNYCSHGWTSRVLRRARLPRPLLLCIERLLNTQYAFLVFGGTVFPRVQWRSGYRQGGPLSAMLFVILVAPLLNYLSTLSGVRAVFGFCDDWQISINGLKPVRAIKQAIVDFELASGQRVHRTKSQFLPCRQMTTTEKRTLRDFWPDASIADAAVVLGTCIGLSTTLQDLLTKPIAAFIRRLQAYRAIRMSLAMRQCILIPTIFLCHSYYLNAVCGGQDG